MQAEIRRKNPSWRSFLRKNGASQGLTCTDAPNWLFYGYFLSFHSEKPVGEGIRPEAHNSAASIFTEPLQILVFADYFPKKIDGGRSWIRTSEGVSQQIYSLPPLATWVSYQPPTNPAGAGI